MSLAHRLGAYDILNILTYNDSALESPHNIMLKILFSFLGVNF